ncbi:MAG: hypothetical protein LBE56_07290 [Tannerella sp.]|nr:hypothetical protein [Tannerella sp.]
MNYTKSDLHKQFWSGQGPCLIFIPPAKMELYDLNDYEYRFYHPEAMWAHEMSRAVKVLDWPTDGIPTVRPNLGVVFLPAIAGQTFQIEANSMPWPGTPLSREQIRLIDKISISETDIYALLDSFYNIHFQHDESQIAPYVADTQGVFDIAHLLYGDEIFYELIDDSQNGWLEELMEIVTRLYDSVTGMIKKVIGESPDQMIHGHGTEQGLFFPEAGIRLSEDTATLLSPEMIERLIIPAIRNCVKEPNKGVFLHYCGLHPTFFDQLTAMPEVKAIDLGNPEMYDLSAVLRRCAETNTVLYSRIAVEKYEKWRTYTERVVRELVE